jgi:hypothetical protein
MRLTLIAGLLKNLKGEIPSYMRREFLPKEAAYQRLKEITGKDFGMDAHAWEDWIREQEASGASFRIAPKSPDQDASA